MADYNAILDTQIEPDAPLTAQLGAQFRDNPIAIAERAPSSPIVVTEWHYYDAIAQADGSTGIIYDHAVDGDVATITSPDFEAGWEYGFLLEGVSRSSASGANLLRITSNLSAGTPLLRLMTSIAPADTSLLFGRFHLPRCGMVEEIKLIHLTAIYRSVDGFSFIDPETDQGRDIQYAASGTASRVTSVVFSWGGTSVFDGGVIRMIKRRQQL